MKTLVTKFKPAKGFSRVGHMGLNVLLAIAVFVLVRMDFVQLALGLMLLSKWRMFAVRLRFWPANIRANATDIIVGVSFLLLMVQGDSQLVQMAWAVAYAFWLTVIKPASSTVMIAAQALAGLFLGLFVLFKVWPDSPLYAMVLVSGLICYLSARHFFDGFDEPHVKLLSYIWGYFGAGMAWVSGHWLLYYGVIAQPVLILLVIGYGLAAMYYLDHNDKLGEGMKKQFVFIMIAVIVIVLSLSDWSSHLV